MSLTATASFIYEPNVAVLIAVVVINIISTILKFRIRHLLSSELLASSFVADLHLILALIVLIYYDNSFLSVALAIGAVVANIYSMFLVLINSLSNTEIE
jgi:hypothetical protein